MENDLYNIISEIPLFSHISKQKLSKGLRAEKLASHSNETYKITLNQESYILKIPKDHTNQYIDRKNEKHNSELAYTLGICPEVIWSNSHGTSLVTYIPDTRCLTKNDLKDPIVLNQIVNLLSKLQRSNKHFKGDVHNPDIIINALSSYYESCRSEDKKRLKTLYIKGLASIENLREFDLPAVPAHIDFTLGNILVENNKQQRLWLIDWEYSAMASPFWDIATICNQTDFNNDEASYLLGRIYSNNAEIEPTKHLDLLIDYRCILNAVSHCWLSANNNRLPPFN